MLIFAQKENKPFSFFKFFFNFLVAILSLSLSTLRFFPLADFAGESDPSTTAVGKLAGASTADNDFETESGVSETFSILKKS